MINLFRLFVYRNIDSLFNAEIWFICKCLIVITKFSMFLCLFLQLPFLIYYHLFAHICMISANTNHLYIIVQFRLIFLFNNDIGLYYYMISNFSVLRQ